MGCKFTKVLDGTSRDSDNALSETIGKKSSPTGSQRSVESHCAKATLDIVQKCEKALSASANFEEEDAISLHMYPPGDEDEDSDRGSAYAESEIDIAFHKEGKRAESPHSDQSSCNGRMSPRDVLSRIFSRAGKYGQSSSYADLNVADENAGGDDISDTECDRFSLQSLETRKKNILRATNSRLSTLSRMMTSRKDMDSDMAQAIGDILEDDELEDAIADDGRPYASSSEESISPAPRSTFFRVVARPMAAKGNRMTFATRTLNPEIGHDIVKFEAQVERLMGTQAAPTLDVRNRSLRPKAARGPRLPSFSTQLVSPRGDPESGASTANDGMRYSKYYATNPVARPQLTVSGLKTATDDCLTKWMVAQQRKDGDWR